GAVEETEAAGPPLAFGVDVGAGFEEHIEHFFAADVGDGRGVERADGGVNELFEFGIGGKGGSNGGDVVFAESGVEGLFGGVVHFGNCVASMTTPFKKEKWQVSLRFCASNVLQSAFCIASNLLVTGVTQFLQ